MSNRIELPAPSVKKDDGWETRRLVMQKTSEMLREHGLVGVMVVFDERYLSTMTVLDAPFTAVEETISEETKLPEVGRIEFDENTDPQFLSNTIGVIAALAGKLEQQSGLLAGLIQNIARNMIDSGFVPTPIQPAGEA